MTKTPFVIRLTVGSGVRRDWYYLSEVGGWGDKKLAATFPMRRDAYVFARRNLGPCIDYINAVRA